MGKARGKVRAVMWSGLVARTRDGVDDSGDDRGGIGRI